eukprot:gene4180-5948_t
MAIEDNSHKNKIGVLTIWAIGVGSALGGDFFGWQFVLLGGFVSGFFGVALSAIFFWIYAASVMDLTARYNATGGGYDFVKNALGYRWAALMASLSMLKLWLANAATAIAISSYLETAGLPPGAVIICWLFLYSFFTALDCIGVRQSASVQIAATILCISLICFYSFSGLTIFKLRNLQSSGNDEKSIGFFRGLPFALQFFDGFEEIPLLLSYAKSAADISKGLISCYITVLVIAGLVVLAGCGATNASTLLASEAPMMTGLDVVYGQGSVITDMVAYFIVTGLIVNFFSFIIFASQQIQAIAEAGQLPSILAFRHPKTGTPVIASVVSGIIGSVLTVIFYYALGADAAQNTLLSASLLPSLLSYILVLQCSIRVNKIENVLSSGTRKSMSFHTLSVGLIGHDPNDLRFRYGSWGARIGQSMCVLLIIGLFVLVFTYETDEYVYGIVVAAIFGTLMFLTILFRTPSEKFPNDLDEEILENEDKALEMDIFNSYRTTNYSIMHEPVRSLNQIARNNNGV